MFDPGDPGPAPMAPTSAAASAAIQRVSDRLAAQTSIWDRQSPAELKCPAWPVPPGNPPQPTEEPPAGKPVIGPQTVELARSALARPGLAAGLPALDPTGAADVSLNDAPVQGKGEIQSEVTRPAVGQSARPQVMGVPEVPAAPSGASGPLRLLPGNPPASDPAIPADASEGGVVPTIAPGANLVSPSSLSGGHADSQATADGGTSTDETPAVRGRMPSSMASLATTPPGQPDNFTAGSQDGFRLSGDGEIPGFGSMATTGGGGGGGMPMDLSRTNELLQQIVDAIQKQRSGGGSSLPAGDPPAYANRL